MATSAFKSTTRRDSIGASNSPNSSRANKSFRRSRSLSRFSRPIEPQPDDVPRFNKNAPSGEFVNTTTELMPQFPDISLDDLALEFFSSCSSWNENGSDRGVQEKKEREGRSVSRRGEIGRWARDTASSRRGRSESRSRGEVVSSSSASRAKIVSSADTRPRRRRSLSVARHQISDSESGVNPYGNSSSRANSKVPMKQSGQMPLAPRTTASGSQSLGRTLSHKDFSILQDGYSSHSSALTDEESKDTRPSKNGFEKIIHVVNAENKALHHTDKAAASGGLYEAMRQEVRYAVEVLRTELNQAMGVNRTALANDLCLQTDNSLGLRKSYLTKLEQLEKQKQDLLSEMLLEEKRGQGFSKMDKELPDARSTSNVAEKPARARKRSSDRHRASKRLTEEAQKYFDDFISNVEDTDLSSFEGEKSDGSSMLGGIWKPRDSREVVEIDKSSTSQCSEMDGVVFPWLHWDTAHDGSLPADTKPETFKVPSNHDGPSQRHASPLYDMEEYLRLGKNEELMFEMYEERSRIISGGLLLCGSVL